MRRKEFHTLTGKMQVQARTQLPGLVHADLPVRQQQHLVALQAQMHRVGAQPAPCGQAIERGTDRRDRRFCRTRHAK